MIGLLRGILIQKKPPQLIIDVSGIGYEVNASMHTFYKLPNLNETVQLFIQLIVREDSQTLYGFIDEKEKLVFCELIKVSGVGPKLALTILSGMNVENFCQCVHEKDYTKLLSLPGVGKKTAERLVIEMHDRLKKQLLKNKEFSESILSKTLINPHNTACEDAINALVSLGYKAIDAEKVIRKHSIQNIDSEGLIKLALKEFAQ